LNISQNSGGKPAFLTLSFFQLSINPHLKASQANTTETDDSAQGQEGGLAPAPPLAIFEKRLLRRSLML
jgi:hypothetical protein